MKITHRIPWATPYAYTEIEYTDDPHEQAIDYTALMFDVASAEKAYIESFAPQDRSLVAEAQRQGATPAPQAPQYQPPQQGSPVDGPLFCKQCSGPAAIRPGAKPMKSRYAPFQMQYPAECQGQCRNPKNPNFSLTTYVDAD